jgi:basic membrane protein A
MSQFDPSRRKALKRMALLGAASLVPAILPVRAARAAGLTAGFVYIGPRKDWGWNESYAVAAAALRGVPRVGVVEAGYLPETTDYGSGKETPETKAYAKAMEVRSLTTPASKSCPPEPPMDPMSTSFSRPII